MAIAQNIQKIRTATLGKEVRDGIADSIEECYKDATTKGNVNMEVSFARGSYNSLGERQDAVEESAKNALEQLTQKATKAELATQKARIDGITALTQGI